MKLANEDVSLLAFTSEQITIPFLLPEMVERVARMLNYFLLQLVDPQRKSLSLKDPEKYEFRPKELLKQETFEMKLLPGNEEPLSTKDKVEEAAHETSLINVEATN